MSSGFDDDNCMVHQNLSSNAIDGVESDQDECFVDINTSPENIHECEIPKIKVLAYSIGHFYNDLCASIWFTYLLIFMEKVVKLLSWEAGLLMLVGQLTDAVCTPLVGIFSDGSLFLPRFLKNFGRRKSWHILGTMAVTLSFPFIFGPCIICRNGGNNNNSTNNIISTSIGYESWWACLMRVSWYIPFIMIFQCGWASIQISHLSMIPELSSVESTRMSMTSYRYAFTVLANLSVFSFLYLFLSMDDPTGSKIGPNDLGIFRIVSLIAVGLGLLSSIPFYALTHERRRPDDERDHRRTRNDSGTPFSNSPLDGEDFHSSSDQQPFDGQTSNSEDRMSWKMWFQHFQFYQTGLLYMFARVYINISQIYFSFYITQTQGEAKKYVALLPLTSYLSSFAVSFLLGSSTISRMVKKGKVLFIAGSIIATLNCAFLFSPDIIFFIPSKWRVFGMNPSLFTIAILLGISQALLLISSLNTTAMLINLNTESSAFVYGAMSFLDKTSNGVIVQIIELFNPSSRIGPSPASLGHFYRNVISFVPGFCSASIFIILITMSMNTLGTRTTETTRRQNDIFRE